MYDLTLTCLMCIYQSANESPSFHDYYTTIDLATMGTHKVNNQVVSLKKAKMNVLEVENTKTHSKAQTCISQQNDYIKGELHWDICVTFVI
jgi:hypothetical protein